MLELKHIKKVYNPGTVTEMCLFDDFNLTVKDGEFVSIVGSNGSGKTSMLNIICGTIPIEGGQVLIGGKDISKMKDFQRYRTIGRVYQNPSMGTCPNLTMLENKTLSETGALESIKQEKTITENSFPFWGWVWKIKWM